LFKHFIALDLSTEIFLLPWFLSLFANILSKLTCKRVWDSFFLDGEIYAIKAGIGLLKYFELELKLSTFDEAVSILLYNQQTEEESLMAVIESINLSYEQYQEYLNL
jgi:hypothetical protein